MTDADEMEEAFSDFLDRYDEQAGDDQFSLMRISFLAGWHAAKGVWPREEQYAQLKYDVFKRLEQVQAGEAQKKPAGSV